MSIYSNLNLIESTVKKVKDSERNFENRMRYSGALAAEVLNMIGPYVQEGVTTETIDKICHDFIVEKQQAIPACLGYKGFTKSVCISVNDEVCHGIPGPRILKCGDIVNIDVTVLAEGVHGDTSKMYYVGHVKPWNIKLCQVTQQALYRAIRLVRPGLRLSRIGQEIQTVANASKYSIVREYAGHFIGESFHAPPDVLHYDHADMGFILEPGMTFTIEPMINLGKRDVKVLSDGWTVKTKDRSPSAQYEHTILVTNTGYEILTHRLDESISRLG